MSDFPGIMATLNAQYSWPDHPYVEHDGVRYERILSTGTALVGVVTRSHGYNHSSWTVELLEGGWPTNEEMTRLMGGYTDLSHAYVTGEHGAQRTYRVPGCD